MVEKKRVTVPAELDGIRVAVIGSNSFDQDKGIIYDNVIIVQPWFGCYNMASMF